MDKLSHLTGVILAGGRSRRFGSDKLFATYQGETLFNRALALMTALFRDVVLVTNTPEKFPPLAQKILQDEIPFQGPLGGIVTALRQVETDGIFVTACDMPLLSKKLILDLVEKDDKSSWIFYSSQGKAEPLCAIYRVSLLPLLESRLRMKRLDLHSLQREAIRFRSIPLDETAQRFLLNVNIPSELI